MQQYSDVVLVASVPGGPVRAPAAASVQVNITGGAAATLYSDNGITPRANPVIADSSGEYSFYAANGTYDLVISVTGFTTETKTAAVQLFDAAASSGAAGIGFLPSGTGAISRTVQAKEREIVSVTDFYANGVSGVAVDPTGAVDSRLGIQAAVNTGGGVYFPSGTYLVTGKITVPGGVQLFGPGQRGATIKFVPTAANTLFEITGGGVVVAQASITGLRFVATGETTYVKKAVVVIDGEEIELGNISIADWSDSTHSSVGFELQGRQTINTHDITVNCDQPFSLKDTPNTATVSCDHFHFWNIYATAHSSQPVWKVASDVWLTNCTWDGYQAWVSGTYGFFWDSSGAAQRSYNVRIGNHRWEQSTNATGYALYINPKAFSTALTIENGYSDANHKGFYLRNFTSGKFQGNFYEGTSEALNVDSTVGVAIVGNFFNLNAGATITTTGYAGAWFGNDNASSNIATGRYLGDGGSSAPAFARFTAQDAGLGFDNNGPKMVNGGADIMQWQTTQVVPGAHDTYDIGATGNRWQDIYAARTVDAWGSVIAQGNTAIPAGGSAGKGVLVSSTANFGVFFGSNAPTLSAAKGSLYLRSDGTGTTDRMYVNTNGGTTWTAVTTVA